MPPNSWDGASSHSNNDPKHTQALFLMILQIIFFLVLSLIIASLTFIGTTLVHVLTNANNRLQSAIKTLGSTWYWKLSYTCTKEATEHTWLIRNTCNAIWLAEPKQEKKKIVPRLMERTVCAVKVFYTCIMLSAFSQLTGASHQVRFCSRLRSVTTQGLSPATVTLTVLLWGSDLDLCKSALWQSPFGKIASQIKLNWTELDLVQFYVL